jgi:hypothetical protein
MPLALRSENAEAVGCYEKFEEMQPLIRERLETFANVKIIKDMEKDSKLSFRYPRTWRPVGIEGELDAGYWTIPEFLSPIIFHFHLPRKLQNAIIPESAENHTVEDFWILYDGMVFLGACEIPDEDNAFWLPAMVRKYLQTELLRSIGDSTPIVIPPSPMHIQVEVEFEASADSTAKREEVLWDPQYHLLTVKTSQRGQAGTPQALVSFYRRTYLALRSFYHAEIDKSIADDLRDEILNDVANTYSDYEEVLDLTPWNLVQRWKAHSELSRKVGGIQYSFCEHALALSRVREAEERLYREIRLNPLLVKAEEYFRSMTEPESMNYDLFRGTLEHVRSHVFVLSQNKYLIYAALAGSLITLLGTIMGYFIHH